MDNTNITLTVNPFALAELTAGKKIQWEKYPDQVQALCEILNISKADLFSENCPVLTPYCKVQVDGTVEMLSGEEAKKRLTDYLAKRMVRRITKKPPMRKLTLKTIKQRIPDILISDLWRDSWPIEKPVRPPAVVRPPIGITDPLPPGRDLPWKPDGYEWYDMGEYFKESPEFDDPKQGILGDCYFIAALSAVVWTRPYAIANYAQSSSYGNETSPLHKFTFYKNGVAQTVEVSEKIAARVTTSASGKTSYNWAFARSNDYQEIWPAVIEKAYAKWKTGGKTDCPYMLTIKGGSGAAACCELVSGSSSTISNINMTVDELMKLLLENSKEKRAINPMVATTPPSASPGLDYAGYNISLNHVYTILGWDKYRGIEYVVLRNPWGYAEATSDVLTGTWECDGDKGSTKIPYGKNGVFALRADTYLKYFTSTSVVTDKK